VTIEGAADWFLTGIGIGAALGVILCRFIYLRGVKDGRRDDT